MATNPCRCPPRNRARRDRQTTGTGNADERNPLIVTRNAENVVAQAGVAIEPPSCAVFGEVAQVAENPYLTFTFWMAFAAQLFLCMVHAVLFRYADFVTVLGGSETHLGWIVGAGMTGSVLMRLSLGRWLDRFGPRIVWIVSLAVLAGTCFAHWGVTDYRGLPIYLLRTLFTTALAGGFAAWTTLIVGRFPGPRMPELLSILGAAGFIGFMLGAHLGDAVCDVPSVGRPETDRMFLLAGLMAIITIPFAWGATLGWKRPSRCRQAPWLRVLRRYQPGWVLLVGIVAGAALAMPTIFLRPFAAELDIPHIGLFFTVSSMTAVTSRFVLRGMDQRLGLPRIILGGLVLMVVAQFLFLTVRSPWQLAIPALAFGGAQAILSPMVIAAGVMTFPARYCGLGSALVLTMIDIGQLLGAPLAGTIMHVSSLVGLPSYPTMFLSTALALVAVGALYAATTLEREQADA